MGLLSLIILINLVSIYNDYSLVVLAQRIKVGKPVTLEEAQDIDNMLGCENPIYYGLGEASSYIADRLRHHPAGSKFIVPTASATSLGHMNILSYGRTI